jgi:hypothetical protein
MLDNTPGQEFAAAPRHDRTREPFKRASRLNHTGRIVAQIELLTVCDDRISASLQLAFILNIFKCPLDLLGGGRKFG